jgi:hypothetical protein
MNTAAGHATCPITNHPRNTAAPDIDQGPHHPPIG